MDCSREDHKFLVADSHVPVLRRVKLCGDLDFLAGHLFESTFAEVAAVGLFTVNHEDCAFDFVGISEQLRVQQRGSCGLYPAGVAIERTLVVAAGSLIIVVVVLHKERSSRVLTVHISRVNIVAYATLLLSSCMVQTTSPKKRSSSTRSMSVTPWVLWRSILAKMLTIGKAWVTCTISTTRNSRKNTCSTPKGTARRRCFGRRRTRNFGTRF